MIVDERDHGLDRRSSSAWAKYADALRRISLAWRNSRISRSSDFIRSRSSLVRPAAAPIRSACRTHLRSVSPVQPILDAIEPIAAHCDADRRVLQHHSHRPLPDLRRKSIGCLLRHGPTFSSGGASGKPGAVHAPVVSTEWTLQSIEPAQPPVPQLDRGSLRRPLTGDRMPAQGQARPAALSVVWAIAFPPAQAVALCPLCTPTGDGAPVLQIAKVVIRQATGSLRADAGPRAIESRTCHSPDFRLALRVHDEDRRRMISLRVKVF